MDFPHSPTIGDVYPTSGALQWKWSGAAWKLLSLAGGATASPYSLPTASASVLGGIKVGAGLTMTAGVLSASGGGGGGSTDLVASLSAEFSDTGTTLADVLSLTLPMGFAYAVRALIAYRAGSTSSGLSIGFGGTLGTQTFALIARTLDSTGAMVSKSITTKAQKASFTSSFIGSDNNLIEVSGIIGSTGSGTLTLQACSNTAFEYYALLKGGMFTAKPLGAI